MLDSWDKLEAACYGCGRCSLCRTKTNTVFGAGNKNADVMLIGEAPGQVEDETGIPFVGPAGKLLDEMLLIAGLDRENVYITNILKCRPPHNRDPFPEEQDACFEFLRAQTALIKPKLIICLGRIAASRIIHSDFRITREHGQFITRGEFRITSIYHPSALLRDLDKRPETFDDLKHIREELKSLGIK